MNEQTRSAPTEAPALAALILFLIAFGLHRGLAGVQRLVGPEGIAFKLWGIGTLIVAILLPLWLALRLLRLQARPALSVVRPSWKRAIPAVAIGFVVALAFNFIWPQVVAPTPRYLEAMRAFLRYDGVTEFVLVFLLVVIVAPLADELLFRGFLLRAWSVRFGPGAAVVLTAVATAVFHTWEPFKLGHAFGMGLLFAGVVLWSRSVFTSFALHALLNALALVPGMG